MATPLTVGMRFKAIPVVRYNGQQNQLSVLFYEVTNAGTGNMVEDALIGLAGKLKADYVANISGKQVFQGVLFQRIIAPLPPMEPVQVTAQAGSLVGDALPSMTCPLISLRGVSAALKHRWRQFMPSRVESENDVDGKPTTGAVTSIASFATALNLYNSIPGTGAGVWNAKRVLRQDVAGVISYLDVATTITRSNWATQRRRSQVNRPDASIF